MSYTQPSLADQLAEIEHEANPEKQARLIDELADSLAEAMPPGWAFTFQIGHMAIDIKAKT